MLNHCNVEMKSRKMLIIKACDNKHKTDSESKWYMLCLYNIFNIVLITGCSYLISFCLEILVLFCFVNANSCTLIIWHPCAAEDNFLIYSCICLVVSTPQPKVSFSSIYVKFSGQTTETKFKKKMSWCSLCKINNCLTKTN